MALWLFGLWLNVQKMPERFFPNSPVIHKYLSSEILKGIFVSFSVIAISFLLRDSMEIGKSHIDQVISESKNQLLKAEAQLNELRLEMN